MTCQFLEEEKQRLRIFRNHLQYVLETNLQRLRTFQLELNEFADWTLDEFNAFKKGLIVSTGLRRRVIEMERNENEDLDAFRRALEKLEQRHHRARRLKRSLIHRKRKDRRFFSDWFWNLVGGKNNTSTSQPSKSFDWRTKNVIGSVKDQLKCGCCYAFATASVLETLYALKTKSSVVELSAQQITDCSSNGNNGCRGGNFGPSIRYIQSQGGQLATYASYPYAGSQQACRRTGINQINLGNIEYTPIAEGDEKAIEDALVKYGPIFIGIDADSRAFMFYQTGILSVPNCPRRRQDMDHAMVIVGHGYDSALKSAYWIIKNSWAERWGEKGYIRLAKDQSNMCGVASMAYYAKLT